MNDSDRIEQPNADVFDYESGGLAQVSEESPPPNRPRPGRLRQGLGMVAAVAVLVVVGGTFAIIFGGRWRNQPGALGSAAASTSASTTLASTIPSPTLSETTTVDVPAGLGKPLQLPALSAGGVCPVSDPHSEGRLDVLGQGPLSAATILATSGVATGFHNYELADGWAVYKTT